MHQFVGDSNLLFSSFPKLDCCLCICALEELESRLWPHKSHTIQLLWKRPPVIHFNVRLRFKTNQGDVTPAAFPLEFYWDNMALAANLVKVALLVVRSSAPALNQLRLLTFFFFLLQSRSNTFSAVWRCKQICRSITQKYGNLHLVPEPEYSSIMLSELLLRCGPCRCHPFRTTWLQWKNASSLLSPLRAKKKTTKNKTFKNLNDRNLLLEV